MPATERTVPLVPRRRLVGLSFGGLTSARRGPGSDVAGSRPYQPGDDVDTIDWAASARLSAARDADEFVVREKFAEEAPRVVVIADRRPQMSVFPPHLPWLSKARAMREATEILFDSAMAIRGVSGYLDYGDGEAFWRPPRTQHEPIELDERNRYDAPTDTIALGLQHLVEHRRSVPTGSFVFVLSDFLGAQTPETWTRALQQRWDIVPVVIQDPVWEQSFPPVGGMVVPFWDPETGRILPIRMTDAQAAERKRRNEERFVRLLDDLRDLELEPVVLSSHARDEVLEAFLDWAELRRAWRGRRW
ncbi:MAG TPA: DUF58 domain-containing protein [Gaiellaceae bacterium]|jgi:hypothetical protein|nr:DUF58 domain-containing protein [Gaiellaceae bacterium]